MVTAQPIASTAFDLTIPLPKMLTSKEELALARAAWAREPKSPVLLFRLAKQMVLLDDFDEAIEMLTDRAGDDARLLGLLHAALLSRETEAGNLAAQEVAERWVQAAQFPLQRAQALADLAKTHFRLGHHERGLARLKESLAENPAQKDAYKRLFIQYLNQDPAKALALAQTTIANGIIHARSLGSMPLALAKLGRIAEARKAEASGTFLSSEQPQPPVGWASLQAFNDALTAEILAHPDMRYERYGTASAFTHRVDEPALHRSKIFPHLQQLVRDEVLAYVANLPDDGHPLLHGRPMHASLRNWCVVTQGEGHETWHVHQNGWLSGVYYIHVQDHIANGIGPEGCIAFGLPEDVIGNEAAAAFGVRVVRPQTGMMIIFPSHVYHRTYPHHGEGHRICFAFDIVPAREE